MQIACTISEAQEAVTAAHAECRSVGLVPTMGALHAGHMALVSHARAECGCVAISIFVNPTQFGPSEDFEKYPRTLDDDVEKCRDAGVDLVFVPSAAEMYPAGFDAHVDVGGLTEILEGAHRPGHFRGVATICAKLFNITDADRAYFGCKDYQQLKIIQKMVRDLDMRVRIVPVETVREPDGLAMSSRNRYLSPDERAAALVLYKSLRAAGTAFDSGERGASVIRDLAKSIIRSERAARIDYVEVADAETLQTIETIGQPAVVLLAVQIGATRLIDNTLLG